VLYNHPDYIEFSQDVERFMIKYGGRPHFGKQNYRNYENIKNEFENFDKFLEIRKKMDPNEIFVNNYLRNLLFPSSKIN
jgi:FAD/FMN-containing dehydrogenase